MNFLFHKQLTNNKPKMVNIITFSTCFYILKSKFPLRQYLEWINNLLRIVNNFNLVIYTNKETLVFLLPLIDQTNKNIKIIIKPLTDFYTYKYKENWIENHEKSVMDLHKVIDWQLNMLWNEKVFLVNETVRKGYFNTIYYGWCDIGYFRNRRNDLNTHYLKLWPNSNKLLQYKKDSIHYGCVQNDLLKYDELTNSINSHYRKGSDLLVNYNEICFAGGFFILHREMSNKYALIYEKKLDYYFKNKYFIKDDQTIVQDIILTNLDMFSIYREDDERFDNWFMFQRLLL